MSVLLQLLPTIPLWQYVLLIILAILLYRYIKGGTPPPLPLPSLAPGLVLGNYNFKISMIDNTRNFYTAMKHHKMSIFWEFSNPTIMLTDLELIKKVQVTDFDYFPNGGLIPDEYLATMGLQLGLLDTKGEVWRTLKKLCTPALSGPRIKKTSGKMNRIGRLMVENIKNSVEKGQEVNLLDTVEKFSMTCIADVGFGADVNCFENPDNFFFKKARNLLEMWRFMVMIFMPRLMRWLRIPLLNPNSVKHFETFCKKIVEQRLTSNVEYKDILQNFIQASKENSIMTPEMMFKTMIQFFTDGFEGLSRISAAIIYRISALPDVQERLFEEMEDVMGAREDVTEEDIGKLTYLDQVLNEGLRMNPAFYTFRECDKPYQVPGTVHTIPKGTRVIIPIAALHFDPDIWDEPEVFNPERFSPENKGNIPSAAYQPFGIGPRQCVGYNLMKMEMKVLFCHFIRNFRFSPRGKMELPLKFHKTESFLFEGGVDIDIVNRE